LRSRRRNNVETARGRYVSPCPGKQGVVVEYLLVNTEGEILAVLDSPAEVARQLAKIEKESETPVRVVRHDEHQSDLVATESFVTATPLPLLVERPRQR
jgi:SHS2 domain-containing protein